MASFRLVPYGPPAALALRDAIIEAKDGDALAPVTVAVPSNYAGLSLRRSLGAGQLSLAAVSGREGLVNVRFLVFARVAELLGAPALAAKRLRPLTGPVRAEAVRAALAADPGVFRDVADHVATERSLEATFRELRQAPQDALDGLARQSERAASVVRLYRDVRRRTAAYYDEEDLAHAAAEAVRAGASALGDVGHVVLYLPRRLSPGERSLAEALAGAGRLIAIIGLTGDANADELARELASQLEAALGRPAEPSLEQPPAGTRVVAVTDAEEEVRTVLRLAMERLAEGTPLHRMAVLYPTAQPYALLAHEQCSAAGVPHNGPAVRTLAQTLSGRTLLGLLRLREAEYRREALMDWLSAAPVLEQAGRSPAPAHKWDTLSRSAGVVGGASQWRERLGRYRRSLEEERSALERTEEGEEWRLRRIEIDLGHAERLSRFVDELIGRLDPGPRASWAEYASWAGGLLDRYLGGEGHRKEWPLEEIEAHRAVEAPLDALSALGNIRDETDEQTFRRALERELDAPAGRVGRFGEGVFVGRIADALGANFDVVFLVGMTEGLVPSRGRDDPLLPDRERSAAGEEMPLRTRRLTEERRDYLAALAAARERILVFPRADLRGQRGRLPARWLLETASQLEGTPVFSTHLETLSRPWFTVVPSFEAALAGGDHGAALGPASEQEYDLRSLLSWQRRGTPVTDHYLAGLAPALGAGLSADLCRQGGALTRWDGRLEPQAVPPPSAERAVSPTALQAWATCPFRYYLGHVLRIAETEQPEETLTLTPLERGNLIHRALEMFIRETPPRTSPDQPWSPDERVRLIEIGERLCDEAEKMGITGRPLLWRLERSRVLRDLAGFLDADERLRSEHGVAPGAVELSFGLAGAEQPALVVTLADGRAVAFRGRIDRVDRRTDGSGLLVLDYKTGSAAPYTHLDREPIKRGQLLQLPIYALAARRAYGNVPVAAYYWFVSEQWDYEPRGYDVGERVLERFAQGLEVIVSGVENGLFPARPGKQDNEGFENCRFCPYDRVCQRDRSRAWQRKRGAPELRDYLDLAEHDG